MKNLTSEQLQNINGGLTITIDSSKLEAVVKKAWVWVKNHKLIDIKISRY